MTADVIPAQKGEHMIRMLLAVASFLGAFAFGEVLAQDHPISKLDWQVGPATGDIAGKAKINIPEGYGFLNSTEAKKFAEITHNVASDNEYVLAPEHFGWFAVFQFDPIGYVKDDEKLDANEVLESIQEGTRQANEERKKRGWGTMSVIGWQFPPQYDQQTKLLEWALLAKDDGTGRQVMNYNTRLLGRTGVMNVVVVSSPETLNKAVGEFKGVIRGYEYVSGEKYSDFRQGDRMAEFGLAALIAGGAAAVATKKGFWAVLVSFFAAAWKFIVAAAVGVLAWIGNLFKKKK